jgi:hypothetical protein
MTIPHNHVAINGTGSAASRPRCDNGHPGAPVDVQSHLYSFSFPPNPDWCSTFAKQPDLNDGERCT